MEFPPQYIYYINQRKSVPHLEFKRRFVVGWCVFAPFPRVMKLVGFHEIFIPKLPFRRVSPHAAEGSADPCVHASE